MKVFISYHRADIRQEKKLKKLLKANGYEVVVFENAPEFEGTYHEYIKTEIIKKMLECDVIICLVGTETFSRPHVDHEINAALKGGVGVRKGIVVLMSESREDSVKDIDYNTFPTRLQNNLEYIYLNQLGSFHMNINKKIQFVINQSKNANIEVNNSVNVMPLKAKRYFNIN